MSTFTRRRQIIARKLAEGKTLSETDMRFKTRLETARSPSVRRAFEEVKKDQRKVVKRAKSGGQTFTSKGGPTTVKTPSGRTLRIISTSRSIRDAEGKVIGKVTATRKGKVTIKGGGQREQFTISPGQASQFISSEGRTVAKAGLSRQTTTKPPQTLQEANFSKQEGGTAFIPSDSFTPVPESQLRQLQQQSITRPSFNQRSTITAASPEQRKIIAKQRSVFGGFVESAKEKFLFQPSSKGELTSQEGLSVVVTGRNPKTGQIETRLQARAREAGGFVGATLAVTGGPKIISTVSKGATAVGNLIRGSKAAKFVTTKGGKVGNFLTQVSTRTGETLATVEVLKQGTKALETKGPAQTGLTEQQTKQVFNIATSAETARAFKPVEATTIQGKIGRGVQSFFKGSANVLAPGVFGEKGAFQESVSKQASDLKLTSAQTEALQTQLGQRRAGFGVARTTGLLQAEAQANVIGSQAVRTGIISGKITGKGGTISRGVEIAKTKPLAGFVEGASGTAAFLSSTQDQSKLAPSFEGGGVPFKDFTPTNVGSAITSFRPGKVLTVAGGGAVGTVTATSFGFLEGAFRKGLPKKAVTTSGFVLDVAEAPGDIATPGLIAGAAPKRRASPIRSLSVNLGTTQSDINKFTSGQPIEVIGSVQGTTPQRTTIRQPTITGKTKSPSLAGVFDVTQTPTTSLNVPTTSTTRQTQKDPVTNLNFNSVFEPTTQFNFATNFPTTVQTPDLFLPLIPGLPGGGGGGGGFRGRRRPRGRFTARLPSILGIQEGVKGQANVLTGLEVRGVV